MGARDFLVDRLERRALRELHRTIDGETALLEGYLADVEAAGGPLHQELALVAPPWLAAQIARQGGEQARHAELLRRRLAELAAPVRSPRRPGAAQRAASTRSAPADRGQGPTPRDVRDQRDRRRLALAVRFAPSFAAGPAASLMAVLLAAEQAQLAAMAAHRDVLERLADRARADHRSVALLATLLHDRKRQLRDTGRALDRLLCPAEKLALARLLDEARAIDRWPSATGAVGLLALGWALRGIDAVRGTVRAVEDALR